MASRSVSQAKRGKRPAAITVYMSVRARRKRAIPGRPMVGYKLRDDGYVEVWMPEHPHASSDGYVREHRVAMERKLGRLLEAWEEPHHRNEVKTDNRPDNLELLTRSEHARRHYAERGVDPATGRFTRGRTGTGGPSSSSGGEAVRPSAAPEPSARAPRRRS